jgi:hypothetical protein
MLEYTVNNQLAIKDWLMDCLSISGAVIGEMAVMVVISIPSKRIKLTKKIILFYNSVLDLNFGPSYC